MNAFHNQRGVNTPNQDALSPRCPSTMRHIRAGWTKIAIAMATKIPNIFNRSMTEEVAKLCASSCGLMLKGSSTHLSPLAPMASYVSLLCGSERICDEDEIQRQWRYCGEEYSYRHHTILCNDTNTFVPRMHASLAESALDRHRWRLVPFVPTCQGASTSSASCTPS